MYNDYKDCICCSSKMTQEISSWNLEPGGSTTPGPNHGKNGRNRATFALHSLEFGGLVYFISIFHVVFFCLAVCFQQELMNKNNLQHLANGSPLREQTFMCGKKYPNFKVLVIDKQRGAILSQCSNPF